MASTQLTDLIISRVTRQYNAAFPMGSKTVVQTIDALCEDYLSKKLSYFQVVDLLKEAKSKLEQGLPVSKFRTIMLPNIFSTAISDELNNHWMYSGVLGDVLLDDEKKFVAVYHNKYYIKLQIRALSRDINLDAYDILTCDI